MHMGEHNRKEPEVELTVWEECCKRGREAARVLIGMVSIFLLIFLGRAGEQAVVFATTIDMPWYPHKSQSVQWAP